jgi:hypothetical protein
VDVAVIGRIVVEGGRGDRVGMTSWVAVGEIPHPGSEQLVRKRPVIRSIRILLSISTPFASPP